MRVWNRPTARASLAVPDRYGLLVLTALVLGLPHGALDHLTMPRARGGSLTLAGLARFCAAYLALAAASVAVWTVAPALAFFGFIVLTWYHWGQGDRYPLARLAEATHLQDRWVRHGTTVVRGGVPMVVPLAAFPDRYRAVAETVTASFGGSVPALVVRPAVGLALAGSLAMVTVAVLYRAWQQTGGTRGWWLDVGEVALLWTTFAVVPPLVAIAVYFAAWHSVRHVVRLLALSLRDGSAGGAGESVDHSTRSLVAACGRLGLDALPATIGGLALLAGLWWAISAGSDVASVAGVYLVTLAALTVPHTVVVTWLDRAQGV